MQRVRIYKYRGMAALHSCSSMLLRHWSQYAYHSGNERKIRMLLCFATALLTLIWLDGQTPGGRVRMDSLVAVRTILVLVVVTRLVGCVPGLNWTVDRLEALYSRSLARIPGEKREAISQDSDYLLGLKRLRRLYCNVGIGFHIQVLPDGRITGIHNENRHCKLYHSMTN